MPLKTHDTNGSILKDIQFSDIFEIDEIQNLQALFSNATGVASIITQIDGTPITQPSNFCRLCNEIIRNSEKGRMNCYYSDSILGRHSLSGPTVRTCLSGDLWDAGVSITVGGNHIANWMIGQVKNEKSNIQHMLKYADEIGVDRDIYFEALKEIPEMTYERFSNVANMLFQFVNQMSEIAYTSFLLKKQNEELNEVTTLLRESEEKYRMLVENSHDIIFSIDLKGHFTYVSPLGANFLGYEAEEMIGQSFQKFVHPDDFSLFLKSLKKLKENPTKNQAFEYRVLHKNGNSHWHNAHVLLIHDENNAIKSYYGLAMDNTAQRNAEQEVLLKNIELEKANRVKDKFFSIVAHDLRSPFGSLLGLSRMLSEDLSELSMDQIKHISENIYENADNLYRLLENMLQWSKIQQDLVTFNLEPVVLSKVANESYNLFRDMIKNKGIKAEIDIPSSLLVYADINIMQTVFRNLISNAEKFTSKGGSIYITAKKIENNFVEVLVKDTGIGMTPELLANIFRQDISTGRRGTDNEPSTGLGLLLCKEFIEKQGGRIFVESKFEKGSTFHFTVPGVS